MQNFKGQKNLLIRKLTLMEAAYDVNAGKINDIYPRIFIVDSKIDLFKNKSQSLQAISTWMKIHPLLRSRIIIKKVYDVNHNECLNERYFEYAPDEKINSLENVVFLRFNSQSPVEQDKIWKLIYENELKIPIDSKNDLLWRLKIIELNNCNPRKYGFLYTPHHAITDGLNVYATILELFEIIENVFTFGYYEINENKMKIELEEVDYERNPRSIGKNPDFYYDQNSNPIEGILIPDFLKDKQNYIQQDKASLSDIDGVFVTIEGDIYAKASELAEKRKDHSCGYIFRNIEGKKFEKLVARAKETNVKLSGCFETIICLALQETFKKFSKDSYNLHEIKKYMVTINTRKHLDPPMQAEVMGMQMSFFNSSFERFDYDTNEPQFWKTTFWTLAKRQSKKLHEFINSKKFVSKDSLIEENNMWYKIGKGYIEKDVSHLFVISSLGELKSKPNNSLNRIQIKEYYTGQSYDDDPLEPIFFSIYTIDKKLFWSMSYNRKLFKVEAANYLMSSIFFIINNLI